MPASHRPRHTRGTVATWRKSCQVLETPMSCHSIAGKICTLFRKQPLQYTDQPVCIGMDPSALRKEDA
jgi:hypothetical protein